MLYMLDMLNHKCFVLGFFFFLSFPLTLTVMQKENMLTKTIQAINCWRLKEWFPAELYAWKKVLFCFKNLTENNYESDQCQWYWLFLARFSIQTISTSAATFLFMTIITEITVTLSPPVVFLWFIFSSYYALKMYLLYKCKILTCHHLN